MSSSTICDSMPSHPDLGVGIDAKGKIVRFIFGVHIGPVYCPCCKAELDYHNETHARNPHYAHKPGTPMCPLLADGLRKSTLTGWDSPLHIVARGLLSLALRSPEGIEWTSRCPTCFNSGASSAHSATDVSLIHETGEFGFVLDVHASFDGSDPLRIKLGDMLCDDKAPLFIFSKRHETLVFKPRDVIMAWQKRDSGPLLLQNHYDGQKCDQCRRSKWNAIALLGSPWCICESGKVKMPKIEYRALDSEPECHEECMELVLDLENLTSFACRRNSTGCECRAFLCAICKRSIGSKVYHHFHSEHGVCSECSLADFTYDKEEFPCYVVPPRVSPHSRWVDSETGHCLCTFSLDELLVRSHAKPDPMITSVLKMRYRSLRHVKMWFGEHSGKPLESVPLTHLRDALASCDIEDETWKDGDDVIRCGDEKLLKVLQLAVLIGAETRSE